MTDAVMVALITGVLSLSGTMIGTYFSTRRSTALITYRIEQLEKKVERHNQVIDRTYALETKTEVQDAEIKDIKKRIDAIER